MKKAIKKQFTLTFATTVIVLSAIFAYTIIIVSSIVYSLSDSYKSNTFLNRYITTLNKMNHSLETYMQTRSFETIDEYYVNRHELDTLTLNLYQTPSDNEELLLEYRIMKMAHTFVSYSDRAVASRRANQFLQTEEQYQKAKQSYNFLYNSVNELNALYFSQNHQTYIIKRKLFTNIRRSCFVLVIASVVISVFQIIINSQKEEELRDKEKTMLRLYQEAQLKALRSQIDPHFLFNTINTGMQLAMLEEANSTNQFLERTANFFRYNLQHQNTDATIDEEIELVESYVHIMNVRFANKFEFVKNVTSKNTNVKIPCMILQPLIENCIKHGKSKSEKSVIELNIYDKDNYIALDVKDNGEGFPKNVKEKLLSEKLFSDENENDNKEKASDGLNIALKNVIKRLKIYYPNEKNVFSILNNSEINQEKTGTTFAIRIPFASISE